MKNDYDLWMKWNERLLRARIDAGKSDADISAACDVKQPSVHAWMKGKTKMIEGDRLLKVCDYLNVSPYWVMFGRESAQNQIRVNKTPINPDTLTELINMFAKLSDEDRSQVTTLVRDIFQRSPSSGSATANDQR